MGRDGQLVVAAAGAVASAAIGAWVAAASAARDRMFYPDPAYPGVTYALDGPILDRYRAEGGPMGWLGAPVSGIEPRGYRAVLNRVGRRTARFQRGTITVEPRTLRTHAHPTPPHPTPNPVPRARSSGVGLMTPPMQLWPLPQ